MVRANARPSQTHRPPSIPSVSGVAYQALNEEDRRNPLMSKPFHMIWFSVCAGSRSWDLPDQMVYSRNTFELHCEMARVLEERGLIDAVVFADVPAISTEYGGNTDTSVRNAVDAVGLQDPVPMYSAMAARTQHIGLLPTMSTTIYSPEVLAETVGTIDQLSRGRAGWNIVTSMGPDAAHQYGWEDLPSGAERYRRAEDFVAQAREEWSSENRVALPQGTPVIMQAGGSEEGRNFAARHADIVIMHRNNVEDMKEFRDDMRRRAAEAGRDPDSCKIFFTVEVIVGETAEEARGLLAEKDGRPSISLELGLASLSFRIGYDLSTLPLDEPVSPDLLGHGSSGVMQQHFRDGKSTLREAAMREATKRSFHVRGSVEEVADQMIEAMEQVGGDGFAIRDMLVPSQVYRVADRLMPELRERGVVRSGYYYDTFRENLHDPDFARPIER